MSTRLMGTLGDPNAKVLLVAIGGTHGNEHEGVEAIQRVFQTSLPTQLNGYFVGVWGNKQAINAGQRYLGHDLNRIWREPHLSQKHTDALPEYVEMREIEAALLGLKPHNYQQAILLDLHTTSSPNGTFWITMPTSIPRLMQLTQTPIIYGLHELSGLPGTTTVYFGARGYATHAVEGGQHGDPQAIDNLEVMLWQMMAGLGMLEPSAFDQLALPRSMMSTLCEGGVPQELDFRYRHTITPDDEFVAIPGLKNFQYIEKGTVLARDRIGEVEAPLSGYLLMPLYQNAGNDGFFMVTGRK